MSAHRFLSVLTVAAAFAAPLAATAQTAPAPVPAPVNSDAPLPAAHHHRASAFFRALGTVGLTADQQQHVDALRAAEHAANAGADEATRAANAAKMRDAIIALLTPDQKMKLDSVWHRGKARGTAAAPAASPAPNN